MRGPAPRIGGAGPWGSAGVSRGWAKEDAKLGLVDVPMLGCEHAFVGPLSPAAASS